MLYGGNKNKRKPFLHINLLIKYSVQQHIHVNGNVFGNKCCRCNEGSLYNVFHSTLLRPMLAATLMKSLSEAGTPIFVVSRALCFQGQPLQILFVYTFIFLTVFPCAERVHIVPFILFCFVFCVRFILN